MRILFLAPHPFYQERGTPIDDFLVLRVLSERGETVDLVTFAEGDEIALPSLTIYRTPRIAVLQGMRPGFSFKKLLNDFFLALRALRLGSRNHYDVVHAGEEGVFVALLLKWLFRLPYLYDLDSSIAQQMVEQNPKLRWAAPLLNSLEKLAIRQALYCLPVCNALAELCRQNGAVRQETLHDISQLSNADFEPTGELKRRLGVDGLIFMYVGNLEPYQGVDLLLDAYATIRDSINGDHVVLYGGDADRIRQYQAKAESLGIDKSVHFLGPVPFDQLDKYLAEADILVCPRSSGVNTPMKIFSYLHTGKPVLVTDLPTHNQILTSEHAYLAPAEPYSFGEAMADLASSRELRMRIGSGGKAMVEKNHVYAAHRDRVNRVYDWVRDHR